MIDTFPGSSRVLSNISVLGYTSDENIDLSFHLEPKAISSLIGDCRLLEACLAGMIKTCTNLLASYTVQHPNGF
jgi:hypothetical protein